MEVINPISDVNAVWTELLNYTDAYGSVVARTRDDGIQTRSTIGATNQHYLGEYKLGSDGWIAFIDPKAGQAGSVARVLLSSRSSIGPSDEVTPIWADFDRFDNIELHIHRQYPGVNLQPGTRFFMDNLLITNPATDTANWVEARIDRAKEWIELFGPPIDPLAAHSKGGRP
jgi:hypothetical protein